MYEIGDLRSDLKLIDAFELADGLRLDERSPYPHYVRSAYLVLPFFIEVLISVNSRPSESCRPSATASAEIL